MDNGSVSRDGKVVSGGHSTRIEGMNKFLKTLEKWPEISSIRLGRIERKNSVGRKNRRMKTDSSSDSGLRAAKDHKRAKGRGGFSFKATRPAMIGSVVTGIKCVASHGVTTQEVVLCGDNLEVLKRRLHAEGYGANW